MIPAGGSTYGYMTVIKTHIPGNRQFTGQVYLVIDISKLMNP